MSKYPLESFMTFRQYNICDQNTSAVQHQSADWSKQWDCISVQLSYLSCSQRTLVVFQCQCELVVGSLQVLMLNLNVRVQNRTARVNHLVFSTWRKSFKTKLRIGKTCIFAFSSLSDAFYVVLWLFTQKGSWWQRGEKKKNIVQI